MTIESLTEHGIEQMAGSEIESFLSNQGIGVLGLDGGAVPYLLPMSFGYGDDALYFTFVVNGESQKERLARQTDRAAFLVYDAATPFQWQSVALTGSITRLPADEWDDFAGVMENAWRPDVFESVESTDVQVYRLAIDRQEGYKHTAVPPGLEGSEVGPD
jgi:nitroimidazol reductase NimA-like FMN-containing flavoprotein (pyridoxamine 5'-phosphate oxidase superfamily)